MVALVMSFSLTASSQALTANDSDRGKHGNETETPIKHVIVLIGENRTFDHVFATYVPKSKDSVSNLLSKGIIKADGSIEGWIGGGCVQPIVIREAKKALETGKPSGSNEVDVV
jgi:phospholipase C